MKAVIKKQDEQINILQHQHLVQQNRLEKSLEKCKINLNDAEQENSDLKSEVIRLKYSVQHVEEKVKQEPEVSKVANGDTPYIQCGPGKVMKRHHEVDGDTMYFCDWDKNQVIPNEEEKPTKPIDEDVLAIESFCNKIMTANELDEERLFSRRYKKLKKNFFPVCRKALKQERPEDPNVNQQPVEGIHDFHFIYLRYYATKLTCFVMFVTSRKQDIGTLYIYIILFWCCQQHCLWSNILSRFLVLSAALFVE